jgi:hypothetical protein
MRSAETSASEPLVGIREYAAGSPRLRTRALLIAVAGLSLIPRLWVARHHPLSFNGAWHLFIARNFWREYASMAHPPLFVLLLKACDAVSHTLLSYRSLLILAGAGCVYLVGRVLQKLGALPAVAVFGALTMACSQAAIILSNLVQGYMLCVFLVLASFFHYLDLVRADRLPGWSNRAAFSTFACLALLVEYMAGLYLLACVVAPLAAVAFSPTLRGSFRRTFVRRWQADCLTLVPPALVGGGLYLVLVRRWHISYFSYAPFYFQPDRERVGDFLARGITGVVNLFAPAVLSSPVWAISLLVVFLAVVLAAPATEREPAGGSSIRLFPALFLAVLLVAGMTLGLLRRYPFGGDGQRHQFLLFLFSVLAGCVALDRLLRAVPRAIRPVLTALSLGAIGVNLVLNREAILKPELEALTSKVGVYRQGLDRASAVHVDEFDLVGLFMEYYGWECRFAGRQPDKPWVERYELVRNGRKLDILAYRNLWIMDFNAPNLYAELRTTIEARGGSCELVFSVNRNIYGRAPWEPWPGASRDPSPEGELPASERARLEASIPALARNQHLETRSLELGDYVSAEFCMEAAANPGAARRRGLPESLLEAYDSARLSGAEAAVFLLKAKFGDGYAPPPATGAVFSDVRVGDPEAAWIEESSRLGFTEGCGGGRYCPRRSVTRAEAAVLLLKGEHGSGYVPPRCAGVFSDVPCPSRYADWIEQLYQERITAGCGLSPRKYCPDDVSSRGQMLTLLANTINHDDPRSSASPPAAESLPP